MEKRKKIYISLPITGRDLAKVREQSDLTAAKLSREGYDTVSPLDIYHGKNPSYADYMGNDLKVLLQCDGIYLASGWEKSCGCQIEFQAARIFKAFRNPDFKIMW